VAVNSELTVCRGYCDRLTTGHGKPLSLLTYLTPFPRVAAWSPPE